MALESPSSNLFGISTVFVARAKSNTAPMIKNYLTTAFRALLRNKLNSFINVFGLGLAMACSILIYVFIADELTYDQYHTNINRTYRLTRNFLSNDGSVNLHLGHAAPPFGPLLKNDFPNEVQEVARTLGTRLLIATPTNAGETPKSFFERSTYFAEPQIMQIFDIQVVAGNPSTALNEPMQLMLSEETAQKYFGTENPLGKPLRFGDKYDVVVSGVFKNFPAQSHWHPDVLVSFATLNDTTIYGRRGLETNFGNNSFGTYVLVKEPFDKAALEAKLPAFVDKHMNHNANDKASSWTNLFLQPVADIHLRSHLDSEEEANGNINTVYMMGVIGIFIILIACFNFINLSTARATKRAKEVGLRKVVGAHRQQLVAQFLGESVLIATLGLIVAVAISGPAIQWLNAFTGKSISFSVLTDPLLVSCLISGAVLVGLLAGVYPAFILSGFKPALTLKGKQMSAGKGLLRKGLVVAQFSISIVLIIATIITFQQLDYLQQETLGYEKDQVINVPYYNDEMSANYEAFYTKLISETSVENAARSSRIPTGRLLDYQGSAKIHKGDSVVEGEIVLKNLAIDDAFLNTYGIEVVAGRGLSKNRADSLVFLLNEAAVKMLGFTNEEIVNRELDYGGTKAIVIGVVKDFHFESLHESIVPMIFHPNTHYNNLSIKLNGQNIQDGIANVEKTWREFMPQLPFEYTFLSETYSNLYKAEQKQNRLFIFFASLAIVIACLGLFGLATFNAMQRVKEIGIRKVLGASVSGILTLLSREIVILILISNLIAWPVAWYFMSEWLNSFAYHVDMNLLAYGAAAIAAVLVSLATVSAQTLKAAMANPTQTLRNE